jgi:hypothetical protein
MEFNWLGHERDYSTQSSAEDKNSRSAHALWRDALLIARKCVSYILL